MTDISAAPVAATVLIDGEPYPLTRFHPGAAPVLVEPVERATLRFAASGAPFRSAARAAARVTLNLAPGDEEYLLYIALIASSAIGDATVAPPDIALDLSYGDGTTAGFTDGVLLSSPSAPGASQDGALEPLQYAFLFAGHD